ncbi:MAG: uroporphyrinogen-III synthase [Polyangiaceae bacterium]
MTESLGGARVALLEARRESELASLVRRHGGEPVCVPALRELETDCAEAVGKAVDAAGKTGAVVALATGAGVSRLLAVADAEGRGRELRDALKTATVVCRGPKPIAVLKREGLTAHVRAAPPHTTRELIAALETLDLRDHDLVFVHDGGGARTVPDWAAQRGARVVEVQPYAWALPEDVSALESLVRDLVGGRVGAVLFTTQVQARHLFAVADAIGEKDGLIAVLNGGVRVGAIGPTTASAIAESGVTPAVVPAQSSMGALVLALARHLAVRADRQQ